MNRLSSKTADPFFFSGACANAACGATQVSFTYTNTGKRASMTDASGTTNYTYDGSDRLYTKATPAGTLTYYRDYYERLTEIHSSNGNGVDNRFAYDADERLSQVTAASDYGPIGPTITTYGYDAAGNLNLVFYPNGVQHRYSYDALNRLTNLAVAIPSYTDNYGQVHTAATLNNYAYTLGAAGNRTQVTELSGRTVQYGYDDLYRLTSETIAGATSQNGTIGYSYDAVGNRQQITSTVNAIPSSGLLNYDANDRTLTDTYDNNGNTVAQAGIANLYDFENHLVQHGAMTIVYDGDGNRVAETVGAQTTKYLVDDQNFTGYAQVLEELQNGQVVRKYSYGLERISENQLISGTWKISFYDYDGHGSVRALTNNTGVVTDSYDYDAFGNLIASTGSTPNNYLFAGEQFDPNLGLYYNRARYLDVRSGRFWGMDTEQGCTCDPQSLHAYLYAGANPTNQVDPSGNDFELGSLGVSEAVGEQFDAINAKVEQAAGQKAKRLLVCEVGKFAVEQGLTAGVYYFLQEIAPGIVLPYVGQTGDLATRIAQHVRDERLFEPVLEFVEVAGGQEARRLVEQKIINVLTNGGLQAGVRSLPDAERMVANLKNEIRLDKYAQLCQE